MLTKGIYDRARCLMGKTSNAVNPPHGACRAVSCGGCGTGWSKSARPSVAGCQQDIITGLRCGHGWELQGNRHPQSLHTGIAVLTGGRKGAVQGIQPVCQNYRAIQRANRSNWLNSRRGCCVDSGIGCFLSTAHRDPMAITNLPR
jgi:hypothetical protein